MPPDQASERRDVQLLLRVGLWSGVALMATGLGAALWSGPHTVVGLRLSELWRGELDASDRLCGLGIVVLAATPAFRVITLITLWLRERDWTYAAVAVAVALVLVLAVVLGHG